MDIKQKQKPIITKKKANPIPGKFIGYGDKFTMFHRLGKDDVAEKLAESDTYGLSAEHRIELEQANLQKQKQNLFAKPKDNGVIFDKTMTEEQKQLYLQTQKQQVEYKGENSFSKTYVALGKDSEKNNDNITKKKDPLDIFKKKY